MGVCARKCKPVVTSLPPFIELAPDKTEADLPLLEARGGASVIVTKTRDGRSVETPLAEWDVRRPVQFNNHIYYITRTGCSHIFKDETKNGHSFEL